MNELFIKGKIIGLPEMLDGREARAYVQREILKQCKESGGAGLVCFTLNAPGPIKVNLLMDVAFYTGVEVIAKELGTKSFILEHEYGHEAYFPIKRNIIEVKKLLTQIEETHPLGRLFDIDVIRPDGSKLSRTEIGYKERSCLICAGPVSVCAPKRTHTVAELQKKTWETIYKYIRRASSEGAASKVESEGAAYNASKQGIVISRLAHMAMSLEVATTPKPGLVDLENNGSHIDMDAETFARSANAINSYFGKCFDEGIKASENSAEKILNTIRPLGIQAENDMNDVTGGVNTHEGLIFSLGIICSAIGWQEEAEQFAGNKKAEQFDGNKKAEQPASNKKAERTFDIDEILDKAALIARPTLGEKNAGARLEASEGFPILKNIALPSLKKALEKNIDINAAGVWTLLKIISEMEDTNMIKRGGATAAEEARKRAGEVAEEFETALDNNYPPEMMKACYDLFIDKVKKLDEEFIEKNLSPGGAADILAIAYFMIFAEEILDNR